MAAQLQQPVYSHSPAFLSLTLIDRLPHQPGQYGAFVLARESLVESLAHIVRHAEIDSGHINPILLNISTMSIAVTPKNANGEKTEYATRARSYFPRETHCHFP
jgi:hypothetical protein